MLVMITHTNRQSITHMNPSLIGDGHHIRTPVGDVGSYLFSYVLCFGLKPEDPL